MRKLCVAILSVSAIVLVSARGQTGEDEARAIVARAIKAMGGEEKIARLQAQTFNEKGTYYGMGDGIPYTGRYALEFPSKFRMEIEGFMTFVVNGDKGWINAMGETKEMTKEEIQQQIKDRRAGWITTLYPLKDKAFSLSTVAAIEVENRPAVGVKVTRKDYPEVKLYFDKESGMLVRSAYPTRSQEEGGKEVTSEVTYLNYRDVDGVQVPAKIVIRRDGKLFIEAENSDLKAGKPDPKLFERP